MQQGGVRRGLRQLPGPPTLRRPKREQRRIHSIIGLHRSTKQGPDGPTRFRPGFCQVHHRGGRKTRSTRLLDYAKLDTGHRGVEGNEVAGDCAKQAAESVARDRPTYFQEASLAHLTMKTTEDHERLDYRPCQE